ncbi:MAG TPA: hypothetical protein VMB77_10415 [Syntrophales bacterium]|nr:hypothetical protein [Syntrophales bacterium]
MSSRVHIPPVFKPQIDPVLQIRLSDRPPTGFSVGQTVDARVLERLGDGRLVITVGDHSFTAEAEPALQPGQAMTLRVDSLSPRVSLSLISPPEERIMTEYLRVFRANPDALAESLNELEGILSGPQASDLIRLVGDDPLKAILDGLGAAALSVEQVEKGFSFRDAIRSLGLMLESELKAALENHGADPASSAANLKTALMRALDEMQAKLGSIGLNPSDGKALRELIPLMERALRSIESQQVLNVHFHETEGKVFFQIPLFLPGLMGKANIFIYSEEGRAGSTERIEAFRVVLALEMDALGNVIAQAMFRGKTLSCRIHCGDESMAAFIDSLLPELENQLTGAGYRVTELAAQVQPHVREAVEECLREEIYGDGNTLNLFA